MGVKDDSLTQNPSIANTTYCYMFLCTHDDRHFSKAFMRSFRDCDAVFAGPELLFVADDDADNVEEDPANEGEKEEGDELGAEVLFLVALAVVEEEVAVGEEETAAGGHRFATTFSTFTGT